MKTDASLSPWRSGSGAPRSAAPSSSGNASTAPTTERDGDTRRSSTQPTRPPNIAATRKTGRASAMQMLPSMSRIAVPPTNASTGTSGATRARPTVRCAVGSR